MKKPDIGQLFGAWKKEDRDESIISLQKKFIVIILGLALLFAIGWMRAPSNVTVHIPPDISSGVSFKVNDIPTAFIYSFAYEIWQGINYWPKNGDKDYPKNLHRYGAFLTPKFRGQLQNEFQELKIAGQVQRERILHSMSDTFFESESVRKINSNTWEVLLKMRLVEYRNKTIVKDIEMLYPLRIVRWDTSGETNPYGLAFDGFASPPVRLKTNKL